MAVQGRCLTLGIELALALAVDIRVAAANARFAQIEIKRGIFPFGAATFRMPAAFGWGNAMRYLLTGDEFGADEALRLGLVQEVVEPGQELERALAIARTVAAQAPLGGRATLESARRAEAVFEAEAVRALMSELLRLMGSEDAHLSEGDVSRRRRSCPVALDQGAPRQPVARSRRPRARARRRPPRRFRPSHATPLFL